MKKLLFFTMLSTIFLTANVTTMAEKVYYNTNSKIYHNKNCMYVSRCTKNCIWIEKKEAIKKGGRPCKKCGG